MPGFEPPLEAAEVEEAVPDLAVTSSLKSGNQGSVFRVARSDGADLVLKVYTASPPLTIVERIDREVDALGRLDSEYVVRLIDHGSVPLRGNPCRWILTPYLSGTCLGDMIGAGPLAHDESAALLKCVAKAIDALWGIHVVHCDIKPDNIIRTDDGRYVIIDLGIAKHLDAKTYTQYGALLGTPGFMSPEQMRNRSGLTLRSDLFALGVVSYLAATGVHPYSWDQQLVPVLTPEPPHEIGAVTAEVSAVIMSLLQRRPTDRPASGQAVVNALGA